MASQDLGAVVREMLEAWNAKDLDRCASYAHPDAEMTNVPFGAKLGFREYVESWARAFPDGKIEIENVVVQGDRAIAEFVGRGTHTGTMKGPMKLPNGSEIPPTGKAFDLEFYTIARWNNEQIVEENLMYDLVTFLRQIGLGQ